MESETMFAASELTVTTASPQEADRRALAGVRLWLEESWRNGEIDDDDGGLETREPTRSLNRFDVPRPEAEALAPDAN